MITLCGKIFQAFVVTSLFRVMYYILISYSVQIALTKPLIVGRMTTKVSQKAEEKMLYEQENIIYSG